MASSYVFLLHPISLLVKARLLIVDDEQDIAEILKEVLEKEGFEVNAFTRPRSIGAIQARTI